MTRTQIAAGPSGLFALRAATHAGVWPPFVRWRCSPPPLFGITATYRAMPAIGFVGFLFSMLTSALVLAWLYLRSNGSILVVAIFHATFDIATTTPTTTMMVPTVMGALTTVAGLAFIPSLAREGARNRLQPARPPLPR